MQAQAIGTAVAIEPLPHSTILACSSGSYYDLAGVFTLMLETIEDGLIFVRARVGAPLLVESGRGDRLWSSEWKCGAVIGSGLGPDGKSFTILLNTADGGTVAVRSTRGEKLRIGWEGECQAQ